MPGFDMATHTLASSSHSALTKKGFTAMILSNLIPFILLDTLVKSAALFFEIKRGRQINRICTDY
jgi:hypothetical protein